MANQPPRALTGQGRKGMLGLGGQEVVVLGLCCGVLPAGVAVLTYLLVSRRSRKRVSDLEAENRKLRERGDAGYPRPWDRPV